MVERTTVRLPQELLTRAKRRAAAEGRTLTSLIEDGLRQVLADDRKKQHGKKRIKLPVSKATGGLKPGLDWARLGDTQELDDIEYIRRLQSGFK